MTRDAVGLRVLALATVAAVALTGCGSTVPVTGGTGQAVAVDGGLSMGTSTPPGAVTRNRGAATTGSLGNPTDRDPTGGDAALVAGEPSGPAPDSPPGGEPAATPDPASPRPDTESAPPDASGRGFDPDTITVGIITSSSQDSFADALGVEGSDTGDLAAQYAAVVDDINRHGGVTGRQLVLAEYDIDFATAVNEPERAAAQVCAAFTQDRQVFAVLQPLPWAAQRDCLAEADVPMIGAGPFLIGQPEYDKYADLFFSPGSMTADRAIALLVDSLVSRGFFESWNTTTGSPGVAPVKLGMLYAENPDAEYIAETYVRELRAHGLEIDDTVTYASNVQAGLAATQSAILRFKAEGITHVIGASVFFLQGAESQGYRPRYVIPPGIGQLYAANSPASQMAGSMTVGWQPTSDVDAAQDPGDVNEAATRCKEIMRANGQEYERSRQAFASMVRVCDVTYLLRDALQGQARPSNTGLRAGIENLGTTWPSAQTWVSTFSNRMHASATGVRDMAFYEECSCMNYASEQLRTS